MTLVATGAAFKLAQRMLRRAPGLSLVAVVCLAAAIGLASAAFSVIHAVFVKPLPVPGGERIVTVQDYNRIGRYNVPSTAARLTLRRGRSRSFEGLAGWYSRNLTLGVEGSAASVARVAHVSPNSFDVLSVSPAFGRGPQEEDVAPGSSAVVLLGHELWRSHFAGDPAVLGRTLWIAERPHRVIGVMPPRFAFPVRDQAWIPVQTDARAANATREALTLFGRLKRDVSRQQAAAELRTLDRFDRPPDSDEATVPLVMPFTRGFMSEQHEWAMYALLLGLVAFVVVTSANLANLFLARNAARTREIALRAALGAVRERLVTELVLESILLATAGALGGLAVARVALSWLQSQVEDLPWWASFGLDPGVLAFAAVAALVASAVAGVAPALRLSRISLHEVLKREGATTSGVRFSRVGAALIVVQVAVGVGFLSVVGVVAQGFFGFSFQKYGIAGGELLVAQVYLGAPEDAERARSDAERRDAWRRHFERSREQFERIAARLREEPGVRRVTHSTHFPGNDVEAVRIQLAAGAGVDLLASTRIAEVGPEFFEMLGARLLQGRDFLPAERTGAPRAVIVNVPFARKYFPGASPLGGSLRIVSEGAGQPGPWLEIVGVAPDLGLNPGDSRRADGIYLPFRPSNFARLALHTAGEPTQLVPRVHEIVRRENARAHVQSADTLASQMNAAEAVFRGLGAGLSLIGGTAVVLSAVSFYSLVSFSVTRRTREIGVRVALGATRGRILRNVLGRELSLVLLGALLGVLLGSALYKLVAVIPFDLQPAGPSLLAAFVGLMLIVGAGACLLPARRALSVDPAVALRRE